MRASSAETRIRILDAAMELFRRQGFDQTTMREIAAEAGVATGAAYYYFDSKDAIVLAFYDQAQQELEPLIEQALAGGKHLDERLGALLEAKLKYFEPNRRLLGALAAHADPEHPLSPFGARTSEIRERDVVWFTRALEASGIHVPRDLEPLSAAPLVDVPDGPDSLLDLRPFAGAGAHAHLNPQERGDCGAAGQTGGLSADAACAAPGGGPGANGDGRNMNERNRRHLSRQPGNSAWRTVIWNGLRCRRLALPWLRRISAPNHRLAPRS